MGHHRRVRLLAILGRIGWAPCRDCWTTRCWDGEGRRTTLHVRLGYGFLTLEGSSLGLVYLSPAQAGRLRGVLRSASIDLGRLGGEQLPTRPTPAVSRGHWRRLLARPVPAKPTVADVMARLDADHTAPLPRVPREAADPVPPQRQPLSASIAPTSA